MTDWEVKWVPIPELEQGLNKAFDAMPIEPGWEPFAIGEGIIFLRREFVNPKAA